MKKEENLKLRLNKNLGLDLKALELAASLGSQVRGLMFRKAMPKDSGLLMDLGRPKKPGIWMLFMRFPIDILFLDEELRLVDEKRNARPLRFWDPRTWRIYSPKKRARYVLEMPSL